MPLMLISAGKRMQQVHEQWAAGPGTAVLPKLLADPKLLLLGCRQSLSEEHRARFQRGTRWPGSTYVGAWFNPPAMLSELRRCRL